MSQVPGSRQTGVAHTFPMREVGLAAAVLAFYLALGAIDRQLGQVDGQDPEASMAVISGLHPPFPLPTAQSQPWLALFDLPDHAAPLVWAFTAVDAVMAVLYGLLVYRVLTKLASRPPSSPSPRLPFFLAPRPWLAWLAAGSDIVENIALLWIFLSGRHGGQMGAGLAMAAVIATSVKWGALLLAVLPPCYAALVWAGRRAFGRGR